MTKNDKYDNAAIVMILMGAVLLIGSVLWIKGIAVAGLVSGAALMLFGFTVLRED